MPSQFLFFVALFVPGLCVGDDTGLIQASLASSAASGFVDLVKFHTESTEAGDAVQKPMRELLARVGAYARNVTDAGRRPALIHIGANDFNADVRWTDMHLYGEVQEALSKAGVPLHSYGLHLVEPRHATHHKLEEQLKKLGLSGEKDADITHALIMGNCPGPTVTMYGPSEIIKKVPNVWGGYEAIDSWSSMDPGHFAQIVHGVRESRFKDFHFVKWANTIFLADAIVALEPDESKWTEERQITCMAPRELLASMGAGAPDVSMLAVDAEGADLGIVSEFMKLDDFAPALIQFESSYDALKHDGGALLETLLSRGYKLGTLMPETGLSSFAQTDADNIYAVRMDLQTQEA